MIKNFVLASLLQTIINFSIYLWQENFRVFNFRRTRPPTKPNFSQTTVILMHTVWRKILMVENFDESGLGNFDE